jgi:septal ring factor EnvC (AmiA/AmiB activator)
MEVNMRKKGSKSNKEKIFSAVISFGIIFALGYGIYSVSSSVNKSDDGNNIVNLNETGAENVALKTEDVTDYPDTLQITPVNTADEASTQKAEEANAGVKTVEENIETDLDKEQTEAAVTQSKAVESNSASVYSFSENDSLMWPVYGDVILKYSMDTTIYFKTLGVYKCNPAINIAADAGTNVGVAADGVVESVAVSEETGTTVAVAIGDGYVTTYGLLSDVVVKAGDKVVCGQLLGKVAQPSAYYEKEGANLYFMLTKDGEPVDPTEYLAE